MKIKTLTASEEKDLGVTFQQDLKFGSYIAEKVNKANSTLSLIVRTFDYIEKDPFILLYKSLVRPHVEYGNTIWYPFLRKDIESVEKIQRRATKLIPELKDMNYTERLNKLKLPSLAHRRRGDMIQTFKIIKGIEDIPSERFLNCVPHYRPMVIVSNWRNPVVEQHYDYSSFHREL